MVPQVGTTVDGAVGNNPMQPDWAVAQAVPRVVDRPCYSCVVEEHFELLLAFVAMLVGSLPGTKIFSNFKYPRIFWIFSTTKKFFTIS